MNTETTHTPTPLDLARLRLARLRSHLCRLPLDHELPDGLSSELNDAKAELRKLLDNTLEPVGHYSGLTRAELVKTGTCETDWN
jgi:hypothetical protein